MSKFVDRLQLAAVTQTGITLTGAQADAVFKVVAMLLVLHAQKRLSEDINTRFAPLLELP